MWRQLKWIECTLQMQIDDSIKINHLTKGMSPTGFRSMDIQITSRPVTLKPIYTALSNCAISNKQFSDLVVHIYILV